MTDKIKQSKTPRNVESITKGALSLGLAERIELVKTLSKANQDQVNDLQEQAAKASSLLKS
jgi:SpoU rRNA methylase family enzyme